MTEKQKKTLQKTVTATLAVLRFARLNTRHQRLGEVLAVAVDVFEELDVVLLGVDVEAA